MFLLWPVTIALSLYLVLRLVAWAPGGGTSAASVSQHALWVGVIGWMASSVQNAGSAGIIRVDGGGPTLLTPESILPALAWPVLGCLAVHAIGQISYPDPKQPRRLATLAVRRVRDFLPRPLAWTTAAIFAAAAAFIAWAATLPGFRPMPYGSRSNGPNSRTNFGGDGRIPGAELAACLGGALLVLAVGTGLVLWLIARRRQLEALDTEENNLLRTIAMNRLLRTVATVAAGLAAIAGNFAARPVPTAGGTSWFNAAGLAAGAVLLVMWWWQPPRLPSAQLGSSNPLRLAGGPATAHPATRLSGAIGPALGLAAVVPAIPGAFLLTGTMIPDGYGSAGLIGLMAVAILLAITAGELLMQRNYGTAHAPRGWPSQAVSPPLLTTAIIAVLALTVVLTVTAIGDARLDHQPSWIPTAVVTAAVGLASLPAFLTARLRRGIKSAIPGLDSALRAITLHRIIRTLAAFITAQAGALLVKASYAWPAALGTPESLWPQTWSLVGTAGAGLVVAALVIAVVPLRTLTGKPARTVARSEAEAAR